MVESMFRFDLGFRHARLEWWWREQQRARCTRRAGATELTRASGFVIAALKAQVDGQQLAAALLALGALSSVLLLALFLKRTPLRSLYVAVISANLVQCAIGCVCFDALFAPAPGGGPDARPRAALLSTCGCGAMWLLALIRGSPLPFRWQWPQLCLISASLIWLAPTVCAHPSMQTGCIDVHTLVQLGVAASMPAVATYFPFHNVPAPSPAAERLCGLYHPVMVLLGLASVAYLLFGAERRQRLQLLARLQRRQRAERAAALARRRFRRPSSLASVPEEPTAAAAVAAAEQKQQHGLGQQERAKQPPLAVCGSKCSCGLELPALLEEGFETASVSGSEKDEASDEEEEGEVAEEGGVEALGGTSKGAEGFPLEVKQQAQQAAGQLGLPVAAFVLSLATAWFCC